MCDHLYSTKILPVRNNNQMLASNYHQNEFADIFNCSNLFGVFVALKKNSVYSVHELASFPIRQCRHVCLPCACVRSMNIQMFKKYEKHLNIQKNVLNAKYATKDRCLYVSLCFVLTFSSYSRFPLSVPSDAHMCMCVCFCLKPLTENKF